MLPTPKSFVSRRGAFGGYEVTGWRYAEDPAWHVKAGREKSPSAREGLCCEGWGIRSRARPQRTRRLLS